ncbi:hypothetical protein E2C01_049700 [Portunus trituberculatus]|uniref:Uncharacterized protein n=1 Tax=Portunus trituberculatus TaxID=210409 RepID=A0A5B7GDW5_PORTR|nr:hypothetical protein [Portunus trituberculatus]
MYRWGSSNHGRVGTPQDSSEGSAEVHVKDGVDDRVERRVDVAEPHNEVDHLVVGIWARGAKGLDHVHEEEGQPADNERAHDDAQRPGGAALFGQ